MSVESTTSGLTAYWPVKQAVQKPQPAPGASWTTCSVERYPRVSAPMISLIWSTVRPVATSSFWSGMSVPK